MTNDTTIAGLIARERELLAELNRPRPLERAESVEAGLAAIARRRAAEDELEATRAHRAWLTDRARAAERNRVAAVELRERARRLEADLADATARDQRERTAGTAAARGPAIERDLEHVRRKLGKLEPATAA